MPSSISALGHQNGCVTLWTPNLPHRAVQLLAHLGLGVSLSVDVGGIYQRRGKMGLSRCGIVVIGRVRLGLGVSAQLEWSAKGSLAVTTRGSVNVM